ncbi:bifunctional metallophosphatase/5'-nucleotidase [Vulcanibacillus modesticaldus]|uniref:bifunctional metallophosphatase/5'-nucleotidase n=1 Tax=Vulcanibacillus modesticaldus TaxID=337097 RepID=UPI000B278AC2|nr:bifunctional UDP-sugar hydrolase/5'-nucleotidase [Vulcanibacillus modesticaldus]
MIKHQRIHIIHTNDLHSHFNNMAKISSYIKKLRAEVTSKEEKVIVVDLGDHMDRMQLETEGTGGKVNVEILNYLNTDVITIGNNEGLTFTKELLAEAYLDKKFRIVACNLKDLESKRLPDWLEEYWIQDLGKIRIGWVGATAPYKTFYKLQGWAIEDPFSNLQRIIQQIRLEVDLIIILSHLGLRADERLAEQLKDVDVILGGHTHFLLEKGIKKENQPLVCQAGIFGDYVGHLVIDYDIENRHLIGVEEKTVFIGDIASDMNTLRIIEKNRDLAKKELGKCITVLKEPLINSLETESPLSNLLADGVRRWVDAEIGLVNTGQILDDLDEGIVTKERIHQICPSPINACRIRLTGEQIRLTLEQSLLDEFKHYPMKGYGFRGKELGTLSISGIIVEYDITSPPYKKISKIYTSNGAILDDKREYIVGTLDMFTFGGGYYLIKKGKDVQYFLPEFLRDILAVQLMDEQSLKISLKDRWIKIKEKNRVSE